MGLLSRIKNWIANEEITAADLNAEFNNIINNLAPGFVSSISANITAMRQVFDPGNIGTENLPSNLSEEIQSLRSMIKKITGETQWYVPPSQSLSTLVPAVGSILPANRIISGNIDANEQPYFLTPDGTNLEADVLASTTDLVFVVNRQEFTKSADGSVTLSAGPSLNNTAIYDDNLTGAKTKYLGEEPGTRIMLTTIGSEFTARDGKLSAFAFTNGPNTEYFIGVYRSSGGFIDNCKRGYLFNSSGEANRVELAASQSITILRISYVFIKNDLSIVYNNSNNDPVISGIEPSSPANGDLWFDLDNEKWKVYNGASYDDMNATLLGITAQSSSACVAARSVDFSLNQSALCDISLVVDSSTAVKSNFGTGKIDVYGRIADFSILGATWDITSDLDTGLTEAASTRYFFYVTNNFELKISDQRPHDRSIDLKGMYHPFKPWRCVGYVDNDSSSDFQESLSPFVYGSSSLLSDHCVSARKLAPFFYDQSGIYDSQNGAISEGYIAPIVTSLDTSGTTTGLANTFKTNGRMVLCAINPQFTPGNAVIGVSGGDFQGKIDIELKSFEYTADTWTVSKTFRVNLAAGQYPFQALVPLFLRPGIWQARLVLTKDSGAGNLALEAELFCVEV